MSTDFVLNATPREDQGKGASRRLRRAGRVPGILYGGEEPPQPITLDHNELLRNLDHEAFYSHILSVKLGSDSVQVILKDLQRHPFKPVIQHIDLMRVRDDRAIRVHVPLHFLNEKTAPGVKQEGGVVSHHMIEVEIECLPGDLPEYIEVECGGMNIGDAIHMSDLVVPQGVRLIDYAKDDEAARDLPVVSVHHARVTTEEDLATEAPEAPEAPTVVGEEAGEAEDDDEKDAGTEKGQE